MFFCILIPNQLLQFF